MNIGKIKAMVTELRNDILNYMPIKGVMLKIGGNGIAANPSIIVAYNIASVVRTGIGVYRITLNQSTALGTSILSNGVSSIDFIIAPTVTSELYSAEIVNISTLIFDLITKEGVVGGGNKLEFNPYDIIPGDTVSIMSLISFGNKQIGE